MFKKIIIIGILSSAFFASIFLNGIILNIDKPIGDHGDFDFTYFIMDNNLDKFTRLDFENLFDTRMFYPERKTLLYGNSEIVQSLIALPLYVLTGKNTIIATNGTILLNFFLSFLATYFLAYFLTRKVLPGIIAGLIFSYNPYVFAHLQHLELLTLFFIPLIFLISEATIRKKSALLFLLLGLVFIMQAISSVYYAFFTAICLPIYLLLRVIHFKVPLREFVKKEILISIIVTAILGFLILKPFVETSGSNIASFQYVALLSAKPTDFIFTTPQNRLYGSLTDNNFFKTLRDPFALVHYTEHSLFFGLSVFFLLGLSFWFYIKNKFKPKDKFLVFTFYVILAVSIVMAMGPFLNLGKVKIALPYLLFYKFAPFVPALRAVGRFVVISYLMLSMIAAFTLSSLTVSSRIKSAIFLALIILISLEYSTRLPAFYKINTEVLAFYSWLDRQDNINAIVELPIANELQYPEFERDLIEDAQYLLYGLYHKKYLVNGYNSYVLYKFVYLGNTLTINFPTPQKLSILRQMGVDTIVVHKDEYKNQQLGKDMINGLERFGVKKLYTSSQISAYSIR